MDYNGKPDYGHIAKMGQVENLTVEISDKSLLFDLICIGREQL